MEQKKQWGHVINVCVTPNTQDFPNSGFYKIMYDAIKSITKELRIEVIN